MTERARPTRRRRTTQRALRRRRGDAAQSAGGPALRRPPFWMIAAFLILVVVTLAAAGGGGAAARVDDGIAADPPDPGHGQPAALSRAADATRSSPTGGPIAPAVAGTVARGELDEDDHFFRGFTPAGAGRQGEPSSSRVSRSR